jgi:hypothetical protein
MDELTCIDKNMFIVEGEWEAIHVSRSRTIQILSITMKMRPMRGTFEAEALIAESHSRSQMRTTLVQCQPVRAISIACKPFVSQLALKRGACQKIARLFGNALADS